MGREKTSLRTGLNTGHWNMKSTEGFSLEKVFMKIEEERLKYIRSFL